MFDSGFVSVLREVLSNGYPILLDKLSVELNNLSFKPSTKYIEIPFSHNLREMKFNLCMSDIKEYCSCEDINNVDSSKIDPSEYDFRMRITIKVIDGKPDINSIDFKEPRIKEHNGELVGYHYRDKDNRYKWFRSRVMQKKHINPQAFNEKHHLFEENYTGYVSHLIDDAIKDFFKNRDIQTFEIQINNLFEHYLHEDIFEINDKFVSEKDKLALILYLIYHSVKDYSKSWLYLKKLVKYRNERNQTYQNSSETPIVEKFLISVADLANTLLKCDNSHFEAQDIFYIIGSQWKEKSINSGYEQKLMNRMQDFLNSFYLTNGTEFIRFIYEKYSSIKVDVDTIKTIVKQNGIDNLKGRSDFWLKPYQKNLTSFDTTTVFLQKAIEWELIQMVKQCELEVS